MSTEDNIRVIAEGVRAGRYFASRTCRVCGRQLRRLEWRLKGCGPECAVGVLAMIGNIKLEECEQLRPAESHDAEPA